MLVQGCLPALLCGQMPASPSPDCCAWPTRLTVGGVFGARVGSWFCSQRLLKTSSIAAHWSPMGHIIRPGIPSLNDAMEQLESDPPRRTLKTTYGVLPVTWMETLVSYELKSWSDREGLVGPSYVDHAQMVFLLPCICFLFLYSFVLAGAFKVPSCLKGSNREKLCVCPPKTPPPLP